MRFCTSLMPGLMCLAFICTQCTPSQALEEEEGYTHSHGPGGHTHSHPHEGSSFSFLQMDGTFKMN
ncbi:MAG: hypothetical protein AAGA85_26305, partial [Bacteroidota bacterium]